MLMNNSKQHNDLYIKQLIAEGENQHLDFKFEISDSRKIARTLVAFSNTEGGRLLIGVKDNGRIAGVRSEEEFYMVQAAADLYCKPVISFESRRHSIDGKTILEIIIPKGNDTPYLAHSDDNKWLAYIRIRDENILATSVHMKVWSNKTHDRGVLIAYSDKVKNLMDYLEVNQYISVSRFCRIAFLPKSAAEKIIADMIYFGLIEPFYADQRFVFRLKSRNMPAG